MPEPRQAASNSADLSDSLAGTIVGRFRIGDRLGRGGMGEVYLAEDTRLKRSVALKRLTPHLQADSLYRRRFLEEAERASRFSDSHIASVYDVFEHEGEIFLVLEYIEGENLRQRLRRPMSLEEFFAIATQCAGALISAHQRGIVHCDIKPENIMLTPAGTVKILDFGVAKHLPRSDQSSTVERAGAMAGTPAYMSPEVVLEQVPDGRADIFSLGVVFYEALTAHHPFLAGSFVATTDRIRHETPSPIRIFNRSVPEGLEALVSKCVAKDPGQRYANSRDLLEDLRLVQAGVTPTRLPKVLPPPVEHRRRRRIIGVILAVAVFAAGFVLYQRARSTPIVHERGWVLISDFESRGDDPIPDAGVREGLTIALQQSRYVNVFPRTRVYEVLERMKKENVTRIDENLGREICQRENLQVLLAGSIEHVGKVYQITVRAIDPVRGQLLFAEKARFDRREDFFDKADAVARKARKDMGESLAGIEQASRPLAKVTTSSLEALQLYSQAKEAMDRGKPDEALAPLQGALQLDPNFAMAHLQLSEYYAAVVSKNTKALEEAKRAYELRERVTDRERFWIEANYYLVQEQYDNGVKTLEILASRYPDDLDYHVALADAYDAVARPDKTLDELRRVILLNPQSLQAYDRLITYLARANANAEALRVYEAARRKDVDAPPLHSAAGLAYFGLGNVPAAREQFQTVQTGGQPFRDVGDFYLAKVDIYEGKLDMARRRLGLIIQRDQAAHIKGLQPESHNLLGRIYLFLRQPPLAQREADQILSAPETDLQVFNVFSAGVLYARSGALEAARKVERRLEQMGGQAPGEWAKRCKITLEAEITMADRRPKQAVNSFFAAEAAYPEGSDDVGLALAYEAQHAWEYAAKHWQQVLNARGQILQEEFPADLAIAHLQLARIYNRLGERAVARRHYEDLLQLWQAADNFRQKSEAETELQSLAQFENGTTVQ
jgi:tetratricopeptide (TPR) repeat protein